MNRQKQILFILLIVLLLAAIYAYLSSPQQGVVETAVKTQKPVQKIVKGSEAGVVVDRHQVSLDLLHQDKKKYKGYKRNIFSYYQPKPVVKPKPLVKPKPVAKPVVPPKPTTPITPQVRKQLARFTFLGFLIKDTERTVFLSKREELFLVKKADFFGEDNQFEVVDVNEEIMTIKQNAASGLIEIKLVEEEPLIPSFSPGKEGGVSTRTAVKSTTPVPSGSSVPPEEQRRKWFKKTQPASTE